MPAYLQRNDDDDDDNTMTHEMRLAQRIPDPMTQTLANSRRFRALPVYTALLDQGRAGYVALVRRNIEFARRVAAWMQSGVYYEVMNLRRGMTTPLNVVLFRAAGTNPVEGYRGEGGATRLVRAVNATGRMQVTLGGGGCVRMGVSNWQTGLADDDFSTVVQVLEGVSAI